MRKLNKIFIGFFVMLILVFSLMNTLFAGSNDYNFSCDGIANNKEIDLSNDKLYASRGLITNPV